MKKITQILISAAALTLSANAFAELDDPPYFNLWSDTIFVGTYQGEGTTLGVCGSGTCDETSFDATTMTSTDTSMAIFSTVDPNSGKGSGAIDPFLRFQHNVEAPGSNTTEVAYNTDYAGKNPDAGWVENDTDGFVGGDNPLVSNQAKDTIAGGQNPEDFNHALLLADMQWDDDGYFHFLLDINEPVSAQGTSSLRLDELAFFVSDSNTMNYLVRDMENISLGNGPDGIPNTNDDNYAGTEGTATLCEAADTTTGQPGNIGGCVDAVWDLDFDDNYGGLNLSNLNDGTNNGGGGSGDFDVELKLHKDLFYDATTGEAEGDYVYLYNFMGEADPMDATEADAGFEEWAFLQSTPGTSVPEPAVAFLLAAGIVPAIRRRRKNKSNATDSLLEQ